MSKMPPHPCDVCSGKGKNIQKRKVNINIPAGISDGQTLRVSVGGEEVFVEVKVATSSHFKREGDDVHTDVSISLSQAVLGGNVKIPGVYEDLTIEVPSGTSSHSTLKLLNKGMKRINTYGHGDHIVHFKVKVPKKLTQKQRDLYTALAELESDTSGTVKGFAKTKDGKQASLDFNEKAMQIKAVLDGSIWDLLSQQKLSAHKGSLKDAKPNKDKTPKTKIPPNDIPEETKNQKNVKKDKTNQKNIPEEMSQKSTKKEKLNLENRPEENIDESDLQEEKKA